MNPNPAQVVSYCVQDIQTKLQSIADLQGKSVFVFNETDLIEKTKVVTSYPVVGVLYEGLRGMPSTGATSHLGLSAEVVFSIIVATRTQQLVNADIKHPTLNLLDSIRNLFLDQISPTGHKYKFMVEAANVVNGSVMWVQRWALPVQLKH